MPPRTDIRPPPLDSASRNRMPAIPVLGCAGQVDSPAATAAVTACLLDLPGLRQVTSGRIAIGLALQQMAIGAGDDVLIPDYHSPSMVPPVQWLGARPVYYRILPDTTADLDDATSKLTSRTRAIMVTHYFGFPQPMRALRAWCDQHGVFLLEDCAHCCFGIVDGRPVGTWGDYTIGSSMKFFPTYDGGCLLSAARPLDHLPLRSAGWRFELKAVLAALERSFAHGRLKPLRAVLTLLLYVPQRLRQAMKRWHPAPVISPGSSDSDYSFEPAWLDKRSALFSRLVTRCSNRQRIAARRRHHYQVLLDTVQGLSGCRPLHPALPEHVVPWQFPLLADQPEQFFQHMRNAGIPVVRFGAGANAMYPDGRHSYDEQVIALPCHQDLSDSELAWITHTLRQVLPSAP